MALEGSIRDFSLADIFQLIGIQRKTGVLTLSHAGEEVKVSFLNGMVVNADSMGKRLDDRLGSVLVKTGKLTPEQLKKALKTQKDTLKKVGLVLVEEGMVRPEDLREALGIQITQIIYRLFRWKDGDYHFEQDVNVDYDKDNFTPMSAESILMEGMRMIDEWPVIERKIPSFELVFERVSLGPSDAPTLDEAPHAEDSSIEKSGDDFDLIFGGEKKKGTGDEPSAKIKLSREENSVYEQVNGEATVQEIIDRTMLSEFEICRALYDLMNRNLIAPLAAEAKASPEKAVARRIDVGGLLAKVAHVALPLLVVASASLWRANPLNLLTPPPLRHAALVELRKDVAANKVRRLAGAVDVYVLLHKAYPGAAQDLLKDGLLVAEDLQDPWGRPLGFEVKDDRIVVSSHTAEADESPLVSQERPFKG